MSGVMRLWLTALAVLSQAAFGALDVRKSRVEDLYNDDLVVTDVIGVTIDTNEVRKIANDYTVEYLTKSNATDLAEHAETNSIAGRVANDSVGFDLDGKSLVLKDGSNIVWRSFEGTGIDTNAVRDITKKLLDRKRNLTDAKVYSISYSDWVITGTDPYHPAKPYHIYQDTISNQFTLYDAENNAIVSCPSDPHDESYDPAALKLVFSDGVTATREEIPGDPIAPASSFVYASDSVATNYGIAAFDGKGKLRQATAGSDYATPSQVNGKLDAKGSYWTDGGQQLYFRREYDQPVDLNAHSFYGDTANGEVVAGTGRFHGDLEAEGGLFGGIYAGDILISATGKPVVYGISVSGGEAQHGNVELNLYTKEEVDTKCLSTNLVGKTIATGSNTVIKLGSGTRVEGMGDGTYQFGGGSMTIPENLSVRVHGNRTLSTWGITDAVPFVEDVDGNKTAVTIGNRTIGGSVGPHSLANGDNVSASGNFSHAEGANAVASGAHSHAEGVNAVASGAHSHAEGLGSTASGLGSHAEGDSTAASGYASHAGGVNALTRKDDTYAYAWNGDSGIRYTSNGPGTFNINPVGGTDGFYIGEQTLYAILTNKVDNGDISATNPAFSNAVRQVLISLGLVN